MDKDKIDRSKQKVGKKQIFLTILGTVFTISIIAFIHNKLPSETQSTIRFFMPFAAVVLLFLIPKKERIAIDNAKEKIEKTKIGKVIKSISNIFLLFAFACIIIAFVMWIFGIK